MIDIIITETAPTRFEVRLADEVSETTHHVTVPAGVGVPGASDEEVVRTTFELLLERQAKEDIMPAFDLPMVAPFVPRFWQQLEQRLETE